MLKWLMILALVAPLTACLEDKEEKSEAGAEVMVESTTSEGMGDEQPMDEAAPEEAAPSEEPPAE